MNTADNVARAARYLIAVHGNAAENIALARAESATGSNREAAIIWRRRCGEWGFIRAVPAEREALTLRFRPMREVQSWKLK
jgi:hypothetical protein